MVPECQHIKPGGQKCASPALRGETHCYFHAPSRARRSRPRRVRYFLELPFPESRGALLAELRQVMNALHQETLEPEVAGRLIYALQLAIEGRENPDIHLPASAARGLRIVPAPHGHRLYTTA